MPKETKQTPLNKRRHELKLTTVEIAKKLNTTAQSVGNWMNGKYQPTDAIIEELAKILNMDVSEINTFYDNRVLSEKSETRKYHMNKNPKETFWRDIRNESGLSLQEIKELLGTDKAKTTIGEYFTGQLMPPDDICRTICDAFGVDFEIGKDRFKKAHKEWMTYHTNGSKENTESETPVEEVAENMGNSYMATIEQEIDSFTDATIKPQNADIADKICESVYSKLSYKDYCVVYDIVMSGNSNAGVLEQIYGKVDCSTFNRIYDIIGE